MRIHGRGWAVCCALVLAWGLAAPIAGVGPFAGAAEKGATAKRAAPKRVVPKRTAPKPAPREAAKTPAVNAVAERAAARSKTGEPTTHLQKTILTVANSRAGEKLEDFCIDKDGRVLALVGPQVAGALGLPQVLGGDASDKPSKFAGEVRVYDADGKLAETWPVGFSGQAINLAPDGTILIGGNGRVARFDAHGQKLHEAESPQMTYIRENPEELREQAREQLESDRALYRNQLEQFENQLAQLKAASRKAKPSGKKGATNVRPVPVEDAGPADDDPFSDDDAASAEADPFSVDDAVPADAAPAADDPFSDDGEEPAVVAPVVVEAAVVVDPDAEAAEAVIEASEADETETVEEALDLGIGGRQLTQLIDNAKQQLKNLETRTVEQVVEQVLARAGQTHSIAASDTDVFVSCRATAGYGFAVWRTDANFGEATQIISSLSGCCGQMDVQCSNGELYVCENSRHRVVRFDRDGKEVAQFGKRDREGKGESFGGCCNPMNLCFNAQGDLYVAESDGVVKHFTPDGAFVGVVGKANVQPGCKNSCVAVTADDSRLFYIDIHKSQIIVLTRDEPLNN